jgi:hypothetical protein
MGSHIIILNSIKVAHDLLDKRSPIYSDRYALDRDGGQLIFTIYPYTDSTLLRPPMAAVRDL